MKKAIFYGVLSTVFFSVSFTLNRSISLSGGFWLWNSSLRYTCTLILLYLILPKKRINAVLSEIKRQPGQWILWSTVGFGLFYLPLTAASAYGESWLVAASWQMTIIAGILLTPIFHKPIPVKNLLISCVILVGVFLLQTKNVANHDFSDSAFVLLPLVLAAFCYPLGNRKMMACCPKEIDSFTRIWGMTLCSMPVWILTAVIACAISGPPPGGQIVQNIIVSLFTGIIGTGVFFHATDLVRTDSRKLAAVEATQSGTVIFTLLASILFLGDEVPDTIGLIGIVVIVVGMVSTSLVPPSKNGH